MTSHNKIKQYTKVASHEGRRGEVKKVILLYSGGLDTSIMIRWIQEEYKAEVITLTVDLGQRRGDLELIRQKALGLGATKALVVDARQEFAEEYIAKGIKANAMYQGRYYLSTPMGRPLLAKWAVKVAAAEGADAIAHGCTGIGNDQIRIEGSVLALNPDIKLLAPAREWDITQAEKTAYCQSRGIAMPSAAKRQYAYDDNMWGVTGEGGEIEDPSLIPPLDKILQICVTPEKAKPAPEYITIEFKRGLPVTVDSQPMPLVDIISSLNERAAQHAVGIVNLVKDRVIGLKVRGVHEAPAAETIITAHKALERYTSTRLENEFKSIVDEKWAYLCYGALWYEPLMDDLNAYESKVNEKITGTVTVKLYKGHIEAVAVETPHTIYDQKSAVFTEAHSLNQYASAGFIEHYTFQMKMAQRRQRTALLAVGGRTQKLKLLPQMKALDRMSYKLYATYKTYKLLRAHGIEATLVHKLSTPELKPNLASLLEAHRFDLIVNLPTPKERLATKAKEKADAEDIRQKAIASNTPLITSAAVVESTVAQLEKGQGSLL